MSWNTNSVLECSNCGRTSRFVEDPETPHVWYSKCRFCGSIAPIITTSSPSVIIEDYKMQYRRMQQIRNM